MRVPSRSSAPHRPQFERRSNQRRTSASDGSELMVYEEVVLPEDNSGIVDQFVDVQEVDSFVILPVKKLISFNEMRRKIIY